MDSEETFKELTKLLKISFKIIKLMFANKNLLQKFKISKNFGRKMLYKVGKDFRSSKVIFLNLTNLLQFLIEIGKRIVREKEII